MTTLLANNASSTLAAGITAGELTVSVQGADAAKFPQPGPGDTFQVTLESANTGVKEIMKCTARAGAILTVVRAQEGTLARAFLASDIVSVRLTKAALDGFLYDWALWTRGMVNVKEAAYGVVGNDAADDAPGIQLALTNAPLGSTVVVPPGNYFVNSTITVPAGKHLMGLSRGYSVDSGGARFRAGAAVSPIVKLDNGGAGMTCAVSGLILDRTAMGGAGTIGLEVGSCNNPVVHDMYVYRSDIAYKVNGALGTHLERIHTGAISGTHLWLENTQELHVNDCRFGSNGPVDVNGSEHIRIKGNCDTLKFTSISFNLGNGATTTRCAYFDTYTSPNGILSWTDCHFEHVGAMFAHTGSTVCDRISFVNCQIGSTSPAFNGLPSGFFTSLQIIGGSVLGTVALTGAARLSIIGATFSGATVVLDACSGSFTNNNLFGQLTVQGAWTGGVVTGNNIIGGLPIINTATGIVSVFNNPINNAANNSAKINTLSGVLSLLDGQLRFPATQNPSSDPNTFDDFEKGTFTYGVSFGGASVGATYGAQGGAYSKYAQRCLIGGRLALTAKGSSVGQARVTGLPFTVRNNTDSYTAPSLNLSNITFTGHPQGYVEINTTNLALSSIPDAGGAYANMLDTNFSNTTEIVLGLQYQTVT